MKKMPKKMYSNIGELIKQIRTNIGISQASLAKKINVSYQQIQRYESGASRITVSRLVQIADALGVPVRTFIQSEMNVAEEPYIGLSEKEIKLIRRFRKIRNNKFKEHAIFFIEMITRIQK